MSIKAQVRLVMQSDDACVTARVDSDSHSRRDLTGFYWCWDPRLSNSQRVSKLLDAQETAERIWRGAHLTIIPRHR